MGTETERNTKKGKKCQVKATAAKQMASEKAIGSDL